MPLTKKKAEQLYTAIIDTRGESKINDDEWGEYFSETANWGEDGKASYDSLQEKLLAVRKASLDRKTVVVDIDADVEAEAKVRVYLDTTRNIESEVDDVFARGIDSARAVTEIVSNSGQIMPSELTGLLNKFQQNMKSHQANLDPDQGMKHAIKELSLFNGALSNLLVTKGLVGNKKEAAEAINFVRDFLWKRDVSGPMCVVEENNGRKMLRYAEPMTFEELNVGRKKVFGRGVKGTSTKSALGTWDAEQPWRKELKKKVGGREWFDTFMKGNQKKMKELSSTPMSRFTPNPANAFDCSDIMVDKSGQVAHISSHERVAITEAFKVSSEKSRQDITESNHLQLMLGKNLESGLTGFMDKWGGIISDNEPIPYTVLHQTLIGDEVTGSPDQQKTKSASVIDSKETANAAVRRLLKNSTILRHKQTGKVTLMSNADFKFKYPDGLDPQFQKVNVDLLETNNGINMWNAGTRVRNNDFNDARQLIGNAVNMFAKVKMKEGMRNPVLNTNLATVTDFLTSPDHSFVSPFKFRGKDVKEAVKALTEELRKDDGAYSHLPKMQRENIALSLQAAVELKCTVHETWLGSAQRNIDNFTRRIPLLGPVLRVVMAVAATPGAMAEWAQHGNDRREMHKASYEGILAESLGSLKGGCMSSADRAGEVAEQRAAMKKQFAEEGKILSYNDSADEKKRVYSKYGSTKAKHDFVEIATGTPGTSDGETRGKAFNARAGVLSHVAETPEEQKLAKDLSGLRKGKYKAVTTEAYLVSQPVGGVVRNASQVAPEPQGVRSPSTSVSTATRSVSTAVPVNNTQPPGPALTKEALKNVTEQREVVPPKKPEDPDVVLTSTHGM